MRFSFGMTAVVILVLAMAAPARALAQEEAVEEVGPPQDLKIGNFLYRLGPGFEAGPFRIHPWFSEWIVFDDNVFLTDPDDPNEDVTEEISSETTIGARADLPLGDHYFSAEYEAQFVAYLLNGTDNLIRHKGALQGRLNFSRVYAGVTDLFRFTDDPVDSPDLDRFQRIENALHALAGYDIDKWGVELGAHHGYWDYIDDATDYLDHTEFYFYGQGFYDFTPKTRATLQYDIGQANFTSTPSLPNPSTGATLTLNDYMLNRIWAGLQVQPSQKVTINGRVGFILQNVDEDSGTNPDDDEYTGPAWGIGTTYVPSPKVKLSVGLLRDLQFSGTSNFQIVDRFNVRLDYQVVPKVLVSGLGFFENSNPSVTDPFQRLGGAVILDYRIREFLSVGAQYEYRQRSTKDVGDYTNNRVLASISLYF